MRKKIAVVTALIGAYDSQLIEFEYDKSKYDFICYTNMKRLKSDTWDIRYVDTLEVPEDNARSAYYFKWNPHKYLDDTYDTMVWTDSSIQAFNFNGFDAFVERFQSEGHDFFIEKHPGRDLLRDELTVNVKLEKDVQENMFNQYKRYIADEYHEKYTTMVETGLSVRHFTHPDVIKLSEMIWSEIKPLTNTKRDQLVFDYCVWKTKFPKYGLFTYMEKCNVLHFTDHPNRSDHKPKVLLVGPWCGEDCYESGWVKFVEEYVAKYPVDTVIVGCGAGREDMYKNINPDKCIPVHIDGEKHGYKVNNQCPIFNITNNTEKDIIRLQPDNTEFDLYKDKPTLSILIMTLDERKKYLKGLLSILEPQCEKYGNKIEILIECDNRTKTIGKKRNDALMRAKGKYVCHIDDDDRVSINYVRKIMDVIENENVDCLSLHAVVSMNGCEQKHIYQSTEYTKWEHYEVDGELTFFRPPNHLNVVKTEYAQKVGFRDMSTGEDRIYSSELYRFLKKEVALDDVLYYYTAITAKPRPFGD